MNILESGVDLLEDLLQFLNPNKHRLRGAFMPEYKVLSKRKKGFNLNGKNIDPKLSMQGVLVSGETGSYKTAAVVLRSILTVNGSQIIHDPSKELFLKSSGALLAKGYQIYQLDFSSPETSLRFNPIVRANTKSEINRLAHDLVSIAGDDASVDDSFWNQKAQEILYVLITIIKTQEMQYQSLYNIAFLLDLMQSEKHRVLVDHLFAKYAQSDEIFTKYASVISQSPNTLSSVLSTAQAAIAIYSLDDNIAEISSSDTIGDFRDFRKTKTALYIHSSTSKMRYYSKVTSIFLSQYFEEFFKELPDKDMLDVFHILDELPLLSIGSLDIICANIRKYSGAIMGVTQNCYAQLSAKYGRKSEAIISNLRTKVFLSADLGTATALERTLGRYEYYDRQDHERLKSRAVLTADEIMSLPANRGLIHTSGMRPILARIRPYFKVRVLRKLTELRAYESPEVPMTGTIPLIPIKEMFPLQDEA